MGSSKGHRDKPGNKDIQATGTLRRAIHPQPVGPEQGVEARAVRNGRPPQRGRIAVSDAADSIDAPEMHQVGRFKSAQQDRAVGQRC